MAKLNIYAGFDISKASFDVCLLNQGQHQCRHLSFTKTGLAFLLTWLPKTAHCVMEATGPYYLRLAVCLYQNGYRVSVVNPLVIRRYGQMRLLRAKTDKADAKLIASYGQEQHPGVWHPPAAYLIKLQQLQALQQQFTKHSSALLCQKQAFLEGGLMDKETNRFLDKAIAHVQNQLALLDNQVQQLLEAHHPEMLRNLTSIPGIGKKTAAVLIVLSEGFTKFTTSRQLAAYVGLSPRIYQSGTSIKGRGAICKMGMGRIRALLYVCAWSAKTCNRSCVELYERLVEKGKSRRLALIAVANKLLKQAFAIATHNSLYQPNYSKKICL